MTTPHMGSDTGLGELPWLATLRGRRWGSWRGPTPTGEDQRKPQAQDSPGSRPTRLFSFNLHPFTEINPNHEYNRFRCVL